ncbi:Metallo-dependent phosphatase [Anaeromyces robustus]|uniref:Metallo-dependent phosphatase n=1 Tax=Anaeromyces robustus TaxID=1754192 RepID=A0A1Y1WYW1_9FUNG|nr:Metallo-dependent phosphatase [Anaeromyces robustus]|eukprot:ORX78585.1 Metallo-dependent phosphatase [Anaeromyces robustus]
MDATAQHVKDFCKDLVNDEKSHEIVHWEDTLISKESISTKVRRSVKKVVKCFAKGNNKNNEEEKEVVKNNGYKRLIALGDIHGDHDHLISILRHAKLIDEENNWIGTDAIFVQLGDLIDRGGETRKVYDTILKLREQAKEKGGEVDVILGNHEVLALQGNHLYTSLDDFDSFGGVEALEEEFGPEGRFGKFIRQEMNITMIINDSLFVHGSITPEHIPEGLDNLNQVTREILLDTPTVDELYDLFLNGVSHPIFANKIFDTGSGPICSKKLTNGDEREICSILEETLRLTNTKRMIVGHNVQFYGKIRTKCNNKLIMIDIGISRCIGGGYYGYLEMLLDKNEIWARYFKK